MKKRTIYILIGVIIVAGTLLYFSNSFFQSPFEATKIEKNGASQSSKKLMLLVLNDFKDDPIKISDNDLQIVSENPTKETIKSTMLTLDWEKFNVVQLKNENEDMMISGSMNSGFSSGYRNLKNDIGLIKESPPKSIEEMTKILLTFFNGKETWANK